MFHQLPAAVILGTAGAVLHEMFACSCHSYIQLAERTEPQKLWFECRANLWLRKCRLNIIIRLWRNPKLLEKISERCSYCVHRPCFWSRDLNQPIRLLDATNLDLRVLECEVVTPLYPDSLSTNVLNLHSVTPFRGFMEMSDTWFLRGTKLSC